MQPIKAIVIGGGLNSAAGAAHRAALRLSGRFNIIDGFFSRDKEINDQSRVVWGVQATSKNDSSLSAFIERISTEDIDLAIVLSPTPHHYEVIKTLMLAGLNVVSEKSITMTSEECMHIDKLRRICKNLLGLLLIILAIQWSENLYRVSKGVTLETYNRYVVRCLKKDLFVHR